MSSLKELFNNGLEIQKNLESGKIPIHSEEYLKSYSNALSIFNTCQQLIDRIGLYSSNETADDITTNDIKYLSLDYHIANLLSRSPPNNGPLNPTVRLVTVKSIIKSHIKFLTLLDSYKLLPKSFSSKLQNSLQNKQADDLPDLKLLEGKDATERRQEKIELFKLEKSLEQKIQLFNQRNSGKSENDIDDDSFRQVQFGQLGIYAIKSFSSVQNLSLEVELLKNMPPPPPSHSQPQIQPDSRQATSSSSSSSQSFTTRLEQPINQVPLLSKSGKVNRPFTIVSSRDQLQRQVQGTGQRLPTMSVEEYLDEEMKRGGMIQGGGEQSAKQESEDEDDIEKQDQETYKAREWDEFTEANPKGSGNTTNRG